MCCGASSPEVVPDEMERNGTTSQELMGNINGEGGLCRVLLCVMQDWESCGKIKLNQRIFCTIQYLAMKQKLVYQQVLNNIL